MVQRMGYLKFARLAAARDGAEGGMSMDIDELNRRLFALTPSEQRHRAGAVTSNWSNLWAQDRSGRAVIRLSEDEGGARTGVPASDGHGTEAGPDAGAMTGAATVARPRRNRGSSSSGRPASARRCRGLPRPPARAWLRPGARFDATARSAGPRRSGGR